MRNHVQPGISRHASTVEIRSLIETHLPHTDLRSLNLRYVGGGELPDAAILDLNGCELRLERDYLDGLWAVATNERHPRLLARFDDGQLGSQMLDILNTCRAQLLED